MARVKGAAVSARITFIRERFKEAGLQSVLGRLAPEQRAQLSGLLLPQAWLPVSLLIDLIEAAEATFGRNDGALCREMARYAAEANLTTLYKIFFRISSAGYVLGKAAALWALHYDSGRLELEQVTPKHFKLRIVDFDTPSCTHCSSVFSWAERSIELSGGRNVVTSGNECRKRGSSDCRCVLTFS